MAVKRLSVFYHSADYITFSFHFGVFEDGDLLMYRLEFVSKFAYFITAYKESQ